jgi:hypothetical protein
MKIEKVGAGPHRLIHLTIVRFEFLMVVKNQVEFLWVVMPCSVVVRYHHFRGPCCLGEVWPSHWYFDTW